MLVNDPGALDSLLKAVAESIDIPDEAHDAAVLKYEDVGQHLAEEDSDLALYKPDVYVQGSFLLGTVVRPIGREDEYDLDLVCRLDMSKESVSQQDLKDRVGKRLRSRQDLAKILASSRRCWTLTYPPADLIPGFHMDVLPSLPNEERRPTGILVTDTKLTRWQKSNPLGYAEWFRGRMAEEFERRRLMLAEASKADIGDVPDWSVKAPLQRCVQLLKRHRDIYFQDQLDLKPVSIILTTLAARVYRNEREIFAALADVSGRMLANVEKRGDHYWVPNPVDPDENFADKWNEYPERRRAFAAWVTQAHGDFEDLSKSESLQEGVYKLSSRFGRSSVLRAAESLGLSTTPVTALAKAIPAVPALASTSHAKLPAWPVKDEYKVKVSAWVHHRHRNRKGKRAWPLANRPVPKDLWIKFRASTNTPEPYEVRWQVVNTGAEAASAGQLRGDFYAAESGVGLVHWEGTSYRGTHWVEAFVVKSGVCVGRSGRALVRIK